jgi:hypothetical protein
VLPLSPAYHRSADAACAALYIQRAFSWDFISDPAPAWIMIKGAGFNCVLSSMKLRKFFVWILLILTVNTTYDTYNL